MTDFGNGCLIEIAQESAPGYLWQSEDDFEARVQRVAERGRSQCARGAGGCCMTLALDRFVTGDVLEQHYGPRAVVWGDCSDEDCPRPDLVVETVYELAKDGEGVLRNSRSRD